MATHVTMPPASDLKQEIAEWIEAFDEMIWPKARNRAPN